MTKRSRVPALVAASALAYASLAALSHTPAGAATAAQFNKGLGVLTVVGDSEANAIAVSRTGDGTILVNGGQVDVRGALATVDNVSLLRVFGGAGDDAISFDETNGALPPADVFGGSDDDRISGSNAADRLFGESGDDVLLGGRGNELLVGGDGDDFVDGNQGADTGVLGFGDDVFQWDAGDGSDVVDGGAGRDRMVFNGAAAAETFDVSANGSQVVFTRSVGTITMNLNGVEEVDTFALGGTDVFTAHDLSGTGLTDLEVNEAVAGSPDGVADRVTVDGTDGANAITVAGSATAGVSVTGLAAAVHITGTDPADSLDVQAGAGNDDVTAANLEAGVLSFSADGGAGDDHLTGSAGDDVLHGGEGDDVLNGGPGNDVLDGGPGANVLIQ